MSRIFDRVGGGKQTSNVMDDVEDGLVAGIRKPGRRRDIPFDVVDRRCCTAVTSTKTRSVSFGSINFGFPVSGSMSGSPVSSSRAMSPRHVVGEVFCQMQDDLFLDFRKRQAGDVDIAVETKPDRPVGPHQPLARNRPAGQSLQHLDDQQSGGSTT